MVMVDKFFGVEGTRSWSGLTVATGNLFCQAGFLQESGLIEHIAQSAAARIGYLYATRGEEPPLGFIGSVDKFSLHALPKVGEELLTTLTVVQEVGDITLVSAQVEAGGHPIADCQMKIFIKKE
jgi:predicted hotdog family 3-hydroxylacyl-ACP dehydratase